MLESILGFFGIDLGDDVVEATEVNENTEKKEIRNTQGIEYAEGDIERIEQVSEIMGEIFTDEVISNWENLSLEEKSQLLDTYYERAGTALGIDAKGVKIGDLYALYGEGTLGVNNGDGYLSLDYRMLEDPANLQQLLHTTTHEMRHQFQSEVIKNPERFPDIPQETIEQWQYEWVNYIDPNDDLEGYCNQLIERDANAFADEILCEYMESKTPAYDVMPAEVTEGAMEVAEGDQEVLTLMGDAVPEGLEANGDLNAAASYTPGQCAKVSTGTQNYCLFAGSGR